MNIFTIVELLQSLWVAFIVIMLFFRFRIGVAAYLAYIFLVPYMKIHIGDYVLQWNFINLIVLIAFFIYRKKYFPHHKYDWRPLNPFFIYFGVSLLLMPFQEGLPFEVSIDSWRTQIMKFIVLPFVIWNDIIIHRDSLKLYRKITIVCIVISATYGLFLTSMPGINPYMMTVSAVNDEQFNTAYAAGYSGKDTRFIDDDISLNEDLSLIDNNTVFNKRKPIIEEGRLFGRISSTFAHPMTFGLFLGLALLYLYRNKENVSKRFLYIMSLIILADVILCGVRSIIAALFIVMMFQLLYFRRFRLFFTFIAISGIIWAISTYVPELQNYLASILDTSSSNVGGSSWEMRLSQLEGCFTEIQDSFLEGKGFGWTGYYLSQNEGHPTMLHFESLIIVILCNSGIIGILLWLIMSAKIIMFNNMSEHANAAILNGLLILYIAYACITGDYGYMQYFILFYILTLGENFNNKSAEKVEKCPTT